MLHGTDAERIVERSGHRERGSAHLRALRQSTFPKRFDHGQELPQAAWFRDGRLMHGANSSVGRRKLAAGDVAPAYVEYENVRVGLMVWKGHRSLLLWLISARDFDLLSRRRQQVEQPPNGKPQLGAQRPRITHLHGEDHPKGFGLVRHLARNLPFAGGS